MGQHHSSFIIHHSFIQLEIQYMTIILIVKVTYEVKCAAASQVISILTALIA